MANAGTATRAQVDGERSPRPVRPGQALDEVRGVGGVLEVLRPHDNERVHFVYIVRCADGTLYTGYARDPRAREKVHNSGRGARYTSGRRPVSLVYAERCKSRGEALSREHQLKRLRRTRKEALIAGKPATDWPPNWSPADSRPRVR